MVKQAILDAINTFAPELIEIRRDIHKHPETRFEEVRTAGLVARKLRGWGIEVVEGVGKTGVVGTLKGKRPGQRAIALRADMDALFIEEANDFPMRPSCPARCTPAAMMGTRPCCSAPRAISQGRPISRAPCISSSNPPRRQAPARPR
jgi:metal-dependent amidase/aminoacylase/carboxypeptidase family protein